MQLTGAQIVIECLKEQGVDTVFGYPGGAILNVYDELYKHQEIRHILTSHAQEASCQSYVYCNTKPLGLMALLDTTQNPSHGHKALALSSHLHVDTDKAVQYE